MKTLANKNAWFIILNYGLGYCFVYPMLLDGIVQLFSIEENSATMWILTSSFYIAILIMMLVAGKELYKQAFQDLKERGVSIFLIALKNYGLAFITGIIVSNFVAAIMQRTTSQNQAILENQLQVNVLFTILITLVFAPLVEELFFRGVIYNQLAHRFNEGVGIFVSASLFGLAHVLVALLAGDFTEIIFALPYMAMGVFIARSYAQSKSFAGALLHHLLQNSIAVVMLLLIR